MNVVVFNMKLYEQALTTLSRNPLQEHLGDGFVWALQGFDEHDTFIRLRFLRINPFESERHVHINSK